MDSPKVTQEQIVALGQRLTHLKGSPGFLDLVNIVEALEREATARTIDFEGWDSQQIAILKARAQAAKEMRLEIFRRIDVAIGYVPAPERVVPVIDLIMAGPNRIAGTN